MRIAALVVLVACRGSSAPAPSRGDAAAAIAPVADATAAPVADAARAEGHVDPGALARVLPPEPGMPIPLAAIHPGDSYDQAAKIVPPDHFGAMNLDVDGMHFSVGTVVAGSMSAAGERQVQYVSSGDVVLPADDALALVTARWGPPQMIEGQPYWLNPKTALRATLTENQVGVDERRLEVHAYLPLEQLLGDASDRFGFEPRPLIGMAAKDAVALLPIAWMADPPTGDDDFFPAELPPTETSTDPTAVMFDVTAGTITSIEVPVADDLWQRATELAAKKGAHFQADADRERIVETR